MSQILKKLLGIKFGRPKKKKKKNSIKRIHSLDSKIRKLDDQC